MRCLLSDAAAAFALVCLAPSSTLLAAEGLTPYGKLGELFAKGTVPERSKISGNWAGRFFYRTAEDKPYAFGLAVTASQPRGPLFDTEWLLCASSGSASWRPDAFDSAGADAWNHVSCTFRRRSWAFDEDGSLINYLAFGDVYYRQEFRASGPFLVYRSFPCETDAQGKVKSCDRTNEDRGYFFRPRPQEAPNGR